MHLGPTKTLQTYVHENRKAVVEFVNGEIRTKFRTVFWHRTDESSNWRVVSAPNYHPTERLAEFQARGWTFA